MVTTSKHTYLYTKIGTYAGFGGPVKEDRTDPKHIATPTRPGRFIINHIGPHTTTRTGPDAYVWSAVPWGTPLRLDQHNVVQIKLSGQPWQPLTTVAAWRELAHNQPEVTRRVIDRHVLLWGPVVRYARHYRKVPDIWIFNDFGHTSVKYYRDINHNGRQDKTDAERTLSDFIHTTPDHELFAWLNNVADAGLTVPLSQSHGCVHTLPTEIDAMIQAGYLRIGATFVVHPYAARSKSSFQEISSDMRYDRQELHFFPGEKKIVVYMMVMLS